MNDITFLPKGSVVKIGYHASIAMTAVGVVFRTKNDVQLAGHNRKSEYANGDVLEDPHGWRSLSINHGIRQGVDEILSIPQMSNKEAKRLLNKL